MLKLFATGVRKVIFPLSKYKQLWINRFLHLVQIFELHHLGHTDI